jgi:hypothetical protein
MAKKGTPTMGGVVSSSHCRLPMWPATLSSPRCRQPIGRTHRPDHDRRRTARLFIGLGLVGFVDDFLKVRKRNSLGLSKRQKLFWQTLVGVSFGLLALYVPNKTVEKETVADSTISFVKDLALVGHHQVRRARALRLRRALDVQRGQPDRRPRWTRHRHVGDGAGLVRLLCVLAVPALGLRPGIHRP